MFREGGVTERGVMGSVDHGPGFRGSLTHRFCGRSRVASLSRYRARDRVGRYCGQQAGMYGFSIGVWGLMGSGWLALPGRKHGLAALVPSG